MINLGPSLRSKCAFRFDEFLSGIGQAVNLARTFGTTFFSGALTFGGGDSRGIIQRELIDKLIKKGQEI